MRWQQVEAELRAQVAALQAAVEEKDKDMRTVMATVDRLQKTPSGFRQSGDISASALQPQQKVAMCFTLFCILKVFRHFLGF